jgi:hypothetical protein
MDAADFLDGDRMHMRGAAFHEPLEPIEKTEHFRTAKDAANRDRTDDAVDAWSWPPSDEHADNGT